MLGSALEGQQQDVEEQRRAALIEAAFFGPNKQYVRWDTGLHDLFEEAVEALGGAHSAKPANIRDRMGIPLLTTAQVKSHLQKHRIRVVAEQGTRDATEAQARAAARLLERQKRQVDGGMAPTRPRVLVPIRGSRQLSGALAVSTGGPLPSSDVGRRPKRRSRKRKSFLDSFSSGEDEEGPQGDEQWEEAGESGGEGVNPARRSRRDRRRRAASSSGFNSERGETDGEGRSAGTTTASPSTHAGEGQGAAHELNALPFAELSRMLSAEGVSVDPATIAGLAQRRAAFVAAASAAVAAANGPSVARPVTRPAYESSGEQALTHAPPALLGERALSSLGMAGAALPVDDAVAALSRQAQLEHALLEQSMWVQKLAAEVQDLRNRQRLGLPPNAPDAASLSSPFALMAQAAFPSGAEPSPRNAAGGAAQPASLSLLQQQHLPPKANLATCDSTLLRLLSSTLGNGSLAGQDASEAAAALLQGIEAAGAETHRRPEAARPPSGGTNLATCDSGLLRMLSQSLREAGWQQPQDAAANDAAAQAAAAVAAAAARLAADAGHGSSLASLAGSGAGHSVSPFADASVLPGLPMLPSTLPAPGFGRPDAFGALSLGLQGLASAASTRNNTSVDMLNSLLGLSGPAAAASTSAPRALSTAEFLRLCSLPGAADLLPANCE